MTNICESEPINKHVEYLKCKHFKEYIRNLIQTNPYNNGIIYLNCPNHNNKKNNKSAPSDIALYKANQRIKKNNNSAPSDISLYKANQHIKDNTPIEDNNTELLLEKIINSFYQKNIIKKKLNYSDIGSLNSQQLKNIKEKINLKKNSIDKNKGLDYIKEEITNLINELVLENIDVNTVKKGVFKTKHILKRSPVPVVSGTTRKVSLNTAKKISRRKKRSSLPKRDTRKKSYKNK